MVKEPAIISYFAYLLISVAYKRFDTTFDYLENYEMLIRLMQVILTGLRIYINIYFQMVSEILKLKPQLLILGVREKLLIAFRSFITH